jgi:uncharacterized protein YaiL (DUF2058 family)
MANSLQEQLVKAGLATEDQARRSRSGKRKDRKQGKSRDDGAKRAAAGRRKEQARRDRELNEKREAQRREQELRQQIRDLVLGASLNDAAADVPYNVLHGSKVRRIYVTETQRKGLAEGALAVVTARGRHHVVPLEVEDRITAMMPDYYVFRADPSAPGDDGKEDDAYAGYEVPDDLMW